MPLGTPYHVPKGTLKASQIIFATNIKSLTGQNKIKRMIKFFRTIRKNLLEEGKTKRYFKYAIGEIVLVVIGILIALQINNWNEQRKERIKENIIVKSLYDEFIANSQYLGERINSISSNEKNSQHLLIFCNENQINISADSLLTLIVHACIGPGYSPKVSTFKRILNNEEFNLIRNDSLKALLNQYSSVLELTFLTNKWLFDNEEIIQAYSNDKFGGIAYGKKINEAQLSKSLFEGITVKKPTFSPNDIVGDPVFESILTIRLLYYGWTINRLNELQEHNKNIRDFIDRHYKF